MSHGLRIIWDPAIDAGAWPGPLGGRAAVVGESWLGPLGLLARLETELGLGGIHATALARASELVPALATRDGWWRTSYDADPLGTCGRLLRDRDLLAMWGWRGEPASARLRELWEATRLARPGIPDRLVAILDALTGPVDIDELVLHSSPDMVEPLWRLLFEQLASVGVTVRRATSATAASAGDLAAARTRGFTPTGDGSLTLLRAHGPLAAADEVAASLAAMASWKDVVIIGADDVLNAALARHGVPRLGGATQPPASASLLRLVIEAAFEPMEPAELHGLLCMTPGPIPRRVATRLVRALGELPGRGSPAWADAWKDGLAGCDDDWRAAATARVTTLLTPAAARDGQLAVAELDRRLDVLATWARGAMTATPSLVMIASLAADARALLALEHASSLSLERLRRLCDELERDSGPSVPGDAGLAAVDDPGALLAPARVVVWWNFTRETAQAPARVRLSVAERTALARAGVTPPDIGALAEGLGARWRRPLELATDALVLVCPSVTASGEHAFPHPLWDELRAAMPDPAQASVLETTQLSRPAVASRRVVAPRALPAPKTTIHANTPIALRERESPSSLERLLACPTAWALHYHGRLRDGISTGPAKPTPLLYGTLAHHILAEVFAGGALPAEAASARARELVERDLPRLCETLVLPRYQVERTGLERAVVDSARALGALMTATGATVRGVETSHDGDLDGIPLTGKIDLLLSTPEVILDLKWGRTTNYEKLRAGVALQLAVYAELLSTPHEVGYFALQTQELFAPQGTQLPDARAVGTVRANETWRGALTVLGERREQLAHGVLHAPAADGSKHESGLANNRLTLAPECGYCSFGGLCGQNGCT
jgi:RecB family exonuclease